MILSIELPANIEATNEANRRAMELQQQLLAFFAPFVGKKVQKQDGGLLAKIAQQLKESLGEFPHTTALQVYRSTASYAMMWSVRVRRGYVGHHGSEMWSSAETTVRVGDLDGDVLVNLASPMVLRTDYTVENIRAARQKAAEAKSLYEAARAECGPFGE